MRSLALLASLILASLWSLAAGAQTLPRVYADDFIEVRSGLAGTGSGPRHLGDVVTLQTSLLFDPEAVQVETLDADFYQREFAADRAIRQSLPPATTSRTTAEGRLRVDSLWTFQVLDCPAGSGNCPGVRHYALPLMTLNYRLHSEGGSQTSGRAARFTPWPGTVTIMPSVAVPDEVPASLADVVPGGAFPPPIHTTATPALHWFALLCGLVLLAVGWSHRGGELRADPGGPQPYVGERRWQRALAASASPALSNEEFADLLRRGITWYCLDERGRNPFEWLGGPPVVTDDGELCRFFADVVACGEIEPDRRVRFLERAWQLTGLPGRPSDASGA